MTSRAERRRLERDAITDKYMHSMATTGRYQINENNSMTQSKKDGYECIIIQFDFNPFNSLLGFFHAMIQNRKEIIERYHRLFSTNPLCMYFKSAYRLEMISFDKVEESFQTVHSNMINMVLKERPTYYVKMHEAWTYATEEIAVREYGNDTVTMDGHVKPGSIAALPASEKIEIINVKVEHGMIHYTRQKCSR